MPRLRDLPWRRDRDPWTILVAEVMLQQTQAHRVIPKWEAFLAAYPDASRRAPPRRSATCCGCGRGSAIPGGRGICTPPRRRSSSEHDGVVPDDLDALLALPGIGPYTARAVLAFAFERDVAVVDTNIARVLARTAGVRLTPKQAQAAADELVPRGEGWAWNQILMDLGAVVCRPTPRLRRVPARVGLSLGPRRSSGARPGGRLGRREHAAVAVRRQRPPGARPRPRRTRATASVPVDAFDPRILAGLVADGLVVVTADGVASLP